MCEISRVSLHRLHSHQETVYTNGKDERWSLSRNTRPPDSRPFPLNHHSSFTVPVTGGPLVQRHRQDPACGLAYLSRPALAPEEITERLRLCTSPFAVSIPPSTLSIMRETGFEARDESASPI